VRGVDQLVEEVLQVHPDQRAGGRLGVGAIRLDGAGGGAAAGAATVSEDEDPLEIVRKCGGPGLRQVGIDIELATTPAISG
jgi:hypothetical protein